MSAATGRGLDFAPWLDAMPEPYAIEVDWAPASHLDLMLVEVRVRWDGGGSAVVEWRDGRRAVATPAELRAVLAAIAAGRNPA